MAATQRDVRTELESDTGLGSLLNVEIPPGWPPDEAGVSERSRRASGMNSDGPARCIIVSRTIEMASMMDIQYRYGNDLDIDRVIDLYRGSTLGERRPIDDKEIVSEMIRHANLVVTAWDGDLLDSLSTRAPGY